MHRFAFRRLLLASLVATGALLSGCVVVGGSSSGAGNAPPTEQSVQIDAAGALTTDPGTGVAILVERVDDTHWDIQTTCDTTKSGAPCNFEIFARSTGIALATTSKLEGNDYVDQGSGEIHAELETSTGIDEFTFQAGSGESVELEAYLDGDPASRYVFWVGRGVVHAGLATNPALFVPN